MQKILITILIIASLLAVAACTKKPEATATAFLKAVESKDFETAKQLVTSDSFAMLSIIESFVQNIDAADIGKIEHQITETKVNGDSAIVTYDQWDESTPDDRQSNEIKLVKVDGEWKVSLEKDNANK